MKTFIISIAFILSAAVSFAQPGPAVFTTVNTTTASATSICVACPVGSSVPAANSGITVAMLTMKDALPSVTTNRIYNIGGALFFNGLSLATGSSISGTTGTVPKFTAATTLGDSNITIAGTTVTVTGTVVATTNFSGPGALLTGIPTSAVSTGNYVATVGSGTGITSSVTSGNAAATTITLANTAVTPSSYWSATAIPTFTVDQQGRLTLAGTATPQLTLTSTYFSSLAATNLTGSSGITGLGTVTSGVWNAGAVTSSGLVTAGTGMVVTTGDIAMTATNGIVIGGSRLFAFNTTGLGIDTVNPDVTGVVITATTGTNAAAMKFANTGGNLYFGRDNSAGNRIQNGGAVAYAAVLNVESAHPLILMTTNAERARVHASGGVSIGDATDPGATNFRVAGTVKAVGQPGLLVTNSGTVNTQSDGATIGFNTEIYDEVANFTANTFTAPVTGRYLLTVSVRTTSGSATQDRGVQIVTSNRTYPFGYANAATSESPVHSGSVIADMDASDTAFVALFLSTGTCDILLGPYFSARLLP